MPNDPVQQTTDQRERVADAMRETVRRYPAVPMGALVFFASAVGALTAPLTAEDFAWARARVADLSRDPGRPIT
jgi:hypothetical protein